MSQLTGVWALTVGAFVLSCGASKNATEEHEPSADGGRTSTVGSGSGPSADGGAAPSGGSDSAGGSGGTAAVVEPAAVVAADAVLLATRQSINSAFHGDYAERVPNDPEASDSETYTNACTEGGAVSVDYETFDTETETDISFIWLTLTACVENGITMNGELYGEAVGGDKYPNALIIFGTPEYSTVGSCEWDMTGTGWDWLQLETKGGTICGVPATSLGPYPQYPL